MIQERTNEMLPSNQSHVC